MPIVLRVMIIFCLSAVLYLIGQDKDTKIGATLRIIGSTGLSIVAAYFIVEAVL